MEKKCINFLFPLWGIFFTVPYEIIISDNFSTDNTRKIAKKYRCKIVDWWLPAIWRNNWWKIANWEYLLFLDADVLIEKDSLNKWCNQIVEKQADIILPYTKLRTDEKSFLANFYFKFSLISYKYSWSIFGSCFFIRKSLFLKIWWFNEELYLLEDVDLLKRARKSWKKINIFPFVQNSWRRLIKTWEFKIIFFMTKIYLLSMFWKKFTYKEEYNSIYKL